VKKNVCLFLRKKNKDMVRILHLVLDSKGEPYDTFTNITRPWYKRFDKEGVTTWYYRYDETINTILLDKESMTMRIPGKESFIPGILDKTISAIQYLCAEDTSHFEYVVRSNASSVLNFTQIIPTLEYRRVLYGSTLVQAAKTVGEQDGKIGADYLPLRFGHGTCIILHHTSIELLLTHLDMLKRDTIDDLSLACFFVDCMRQKLTPHNLQAEQVGEQYLGFGPHINLHKAFTFRNRHFESTDRQIDIDMARAQVNALTTRFFDFPKQHSYVQKIMYHNRDITAIVFSFVREYGVWTTDGLNNKLDAVFGDPAPNVPKVLEVTLFNGTRLAQNTTWIFVFDKPNGSFLRAC